MLQKSLYIVPELAIFCGILHLYIRHYFVDDSPKMLSRVARIWLLISLFFTILFYNQNNNTFYLIDNTYTLLFKLMISMFSYGLLGISTQYFTANKKIALKFYVTLLLSLAIMNIMLSAVNIIILSLSYILLLLTSYRLLELRDDKTSSSISHNFGTDTIILLLLTIGTSGLYILTDGKPNYQILNNLLSENTNSFPLYMFVVCIIIPFLYSLGIVPFHSHTEDRCGRAILPVSHYLMVIAPWAYWGTFIKLNILSLSLLAEKLSPVYIIFAILSLGFGAMGANARINLHRIYSFCVIYYFGTILLLIAMFNPIADYAAFSCLLICLLGINGIYLVFYSMKSRNEYLSSLASLSGLAKTKPYTTATLLISLFSLMGMPPLAGFLGQATLTSELIFAKYYVSLACVFFFLLLLAKVYLEIIKTAYFEQKIIVFDTENKVLKIYMLINIICLSLMAFNPFDIIEILKDMFNVVFL